MVLCTVGFVLLRAVVLGVGDLVGCKQYPLGGVRDTVILPDRLPRWKGNIRTQRWGGGSPYTG